MDIQKLIKVSAKATDISLVGLLVSYLLITVFSVSELSDHILGLASYVIRVLGLSLLLSTSINLLANAYRLFRDSLKGKDILGIFLGVWTVFYPLVTIALLVIALSIEEYLLVNWASSLVLLSFVLSIVSFKRFKRVGGNFSVSYAFLGFAIPVFLIVSLSYVSNGSPHSNAVIKSSMSQIRSAAELSNMKAGSYANIRNDEGLKKLVNAINSKTGRKDDVLISPDNTRWCMKVRLISEKWEKDITYNCIDSIGFVGTLGEDNTVCDAGYGNYSCK
jgi:hypothetical protein